MVQLKAGTIYGHVGTGGLVLVFQNNRLTLSIFYVLITKYASDSMIPSVIGPTKSRS